MNSPPIDRSDRLERLKGVRSLPVERRDSRVERSPAPSERYDRVEISDAGRARASVRLEPTTPGSGDRLTEIRRRVLGSAYDSNQVVAEVANRILDRGDV